MSELGRKKIVISGQTAAKTGRPGLIAVSLLLAGSFLVAFFLGYSYLQDERTTEAPVLPPPTSQQERSFEHSDGVLRKTSTFAQILSTLSIAEDTRDKLLAERLLKARPSVLAGSIYRIEYGTGEDRPVRSFSIELDDTTLVKLQFLPYARVESQRRELVNRPVRYAGVITRNFWLSILENDTLHHSLIPLVEEAMKWTVDLFHLGPGDRYKLVYREIFRDGQSMGVSGVEAIRIQTVNRTYTAFAHPIGDSLIYLDYFGAGLQQRFLRAPVKFGIVTSPFSRARLHPVTGVLKRHGGTDFAAPPGSPIYALADGRISRLNQDQNNGKYVDLAHDQTYSTMYLHMDDFVPELKTGSWVRQGQVIGYVGSTGLATGPHVCLRFRRNGIEEDFLDYREETSLVSAVGNQRQFIERRDSLTEILDRMEYEELMF